MNLNNDSMNSSSFDSALCEVNPVTAQQSNINNELSSIQSKVRLAFDALSQIARNLNQEDQVLDIEKHVIDMESTLVNLK